jgi:hypothetical protein
VAAAKRIPRAISPELAARKVGPSCHIGFSGSYYSVPHTLYGQMVFVRASDLSVDILNNQGELVATHRRCFFKRKYMTNPDHMPEYYISFFDLACFDARRFRLWAKDIGDNTYAVIDKLLASRPVEQQSYKLCMAVLQLAKKYGAGLLDLSCRIALDDNRCNYSAIKKIIAAEHEKRAFH